MEQKKQIYRNEWKYVISYPEAELLKKRLEPFMQYDSHAVDGSYMIRSLYFDDWKNSAYEQKHLEFVFSPALVICPSEFDWSFVQLGGDTDINPWLTNFYGLSFGIGYRF